MSLASPGDVEQALGRPLNPAEQNQVGVLLEEASDLVLGHLGDVLASPVPDAVARVAARMVARALRREGDTTPADVTQVGQGSGPFSRQFTFAPGATSGSVWIDTADKLKLRPYRTGMRSVSLGGEHTGRYRGLR